MTRQMEPVDILAKASLLAQLTSEPSIPAPARTEHLSRFDELIDDPDLRAASRALFSNQHYSNAVLEGFKCLNNEVKRRSGNTSADGASLMRSAFSANSPILKLNDLKSQSKRDQQAGYMDIFAGVMTGVRNPRAHEHRHIDEPEVALELLVVANHLFRMLRQTKRARRKSA